MLHPSEISSQSTSQPAVSQLEIPNQSTSQPVVSQVPVPVPVVSQVVSQSNTLTTSIIAGGGWLSNLVIPVNSGVDPVEPVRQVDDVSPIHNLDNPDRRV